MKPKSLLTTLLLIICLGTYTVLNTSYSSGFGSYTASCGCHGAATTATTVTVNGLPTFYTPGASYPITVTVTNTTNNQAGFQVQTNIGTLSSTDPDVTVQGGSMSAGHNKRKSMVSNTATFSLTWTAPNPGGTAASFNAVGNAVNGSGTGGDMWNSAASTNIALPVHLTNVIANRVDNHVLISFTASKEENVRQFEVERSIDGSTFNTIATIESTGVGNYTYQDHSATGTNFYRIKEVSHDGEVSYSQIVKSSIQKNNVVLIYPTVLEGNTISISNIDKNDLLELTLYSLLGRPVFHTDIESNNILLSALNPGTYVAVLTKGNNVIKVQKIVRK